MPPRSLRRLPPLVLLALLAVALGQGAANPAAPADVGLALGARAMIDAPVRDAPDAGFDRAEARGEGGEVIAVLDLTLATDGARLRGALPDLRGHPALLQADGEALWPCPMTVSGPAGLLPVGVWVGGDGAVVELANQPMPAAPAAGYRQLLLLFADADVRVTGACADPAIGLRVDAYLRPGWNLLVSEVVTTPAGLGVLLRSSAPADLADAAWYWRDGAVRAGDAEVAPTRP